MSLLARTMAEQRAAMTAAADAALLGLSGAPIHGPPDPPLTVEQFATLASAEATIREIEARYAHLRAPYCIAGVNRIA